MTNLQSNGHIVRTESTIQMDQIQNLRLLHNVDYMDKNINRNQHPHLIKNTLTNGRIWLRKVY